MEKALTAENRIKFVSFLVEGDEGAVCYNGRRSVWVECCSGGRYGLYLDNEYLTLTNDVHAALWFLKTGEWVALSGKLFVDGEEA